MLFGAPLHGAPSSLLHVRSEPDDETRRCAECEREREAVPIVVRFVSWITFGTIMDDA